MWLRYKRAFLIFPNLAVLVFVISFGLYRVSAQGGSSWLANDAPTVSKVAELSGGEDRDNQTIPCNRLTYTADGQTTPQTVCAYPSSMGLLTTDSRIQIGSNTFAPLKGPTRLSTVIPVVDRSLTLVSLPAPTIGNEIGVYHNLSKANLDKGMGEGGDVYYQIHKDPEAFLRDPFTHQPLQLSANDIVFSANGEWMVADMPQGGLVRINMQDLSVKLFAGPIEPAWFLGVANPPLAISDDGRYVAANTDIWGTGRLDMYDLSTCDSQLDVLPSKATYCAGKDIWQGMTLAGQSSGKGIVDAWAGIQHPSQLEFNNDDTLSFTAWHDVTSNSVYKVARFAATAPGEIVHKLGLLGMGDSYISGQGAFEYTPESDDGNDTCHVSPLAYTFLLGKRYFNSYTSIACSGATTDNLTGHSPAYKGQVAHKIEEQYRDKPTILANFLPGYIYQQEFASTYLPEAILLSVGGDDIGFADIVKSCVANSGGGTCFNTYEDRAELVQRINATYLKLVDTYTTIRDQSGGARVYVVGYPQVAKVGGDCGLNVHLNSDEVLFASQLIDYLNSVVERAAQAAGVSYVDTQHALDGHRLCESGDKAMNGFTVGGDAGVTVPVLNHVVNFIGSESYHPTPLGYQLLAQTIAAKTANLTATMPIPAASGAPKFDSSIPLLAGAPITGRPINVTNYDSTISDDAALAGASERVEVDGTAMALQPYSTYQVVLHSTPVLLDEGGVDADGNVNTTVRVPLDTAPGYHMLHVYTTNMAGESVDIQKLVYIAPGGSGASLLNSADACGAVLSSGQDADQDGTDDACDPIIKAPKVASSSKIVARADIAQTRPQSVQSQPVQSAETSKSVTTTKILGATTITSQSSAKIADVQVHNIAKQPLFRLNWVQVLMAGLPLTGGVSAVAAYINRRQL